ncbi:MAG: phosphotransferase family protein [Dehalococcoidia bacterium]|nr:phosphotransferase family protein [Dehalococcoidia bacterium]
MAWREALAEYLARRLPSASSVEVVNVQGMPAGASNDTVSFDARVRAGDEMVDLPLVLRPQRPDGILAPYDVSMQFRVMRALSRTEVPVPAVAWFEPDLTVLGVPFFIMERVAGETLPLFWYGRSPRLDAGAAALAAIHAVDWRQAGLDFLLPSGTAAVTPSDSELAPWRARAERLRIARAPLLVALGEWLRQNEPPSARFALLHGDPNPGNYLFRGNTVVTVLDWEVAGIGDPRSDLGFYAALHTVFGGMGMPGSRTLLADAYEGVTGQPLHDLEYYEASGLYRMAVVMAGWAVRFIGMGPGGTMDAISRRLSVILGPRWAA